MNRLERGSVRDPDPMLPESRHQSMKALLQKSDEPAPRRWWDAVLDFLDRIWL